MNELAEYDRYHCKSCGVTFRERYPRFYDVTPCPACRSSSVNVSFLRRSAAGRPSTA